jgi:WD40 repeat protein
LVTFTNLTDMARGVAFSPEGKMLACTWGQRITLLDVTTRSEIVQLRGHQSRATALAFTLDGRTLITGGGTGMAPGGDGSVRVWDVAARPRETDRQHYQTAVGEFSRGNGTALCLSPDGRHLLLVFVDNTFSIWETATLTESQHRPLPVAEFGCAALVSGGKVAAFVAKDGNVVFWHTDTGQTNWFAMRTSRRGFNRAAFSPDGQRFAVDCSGEVCVFDVASHNRLHTFSVRDGDAAHSLSFSRDGQRLMAGYGSGLVKVWGLAGNNEEATLRGHDHMVNDVALMSDGRTLVSSSLDVRFWDLSSQRELFLPLRPRPNPFSGCSISPDGRRLAVGGIDGLITIWDLASRQEVATLKADERRALAVAFLSDGNTLVSAGLGELRVWRAASFEEADREALKK